jgi:O-antigen/teichoic acid export membrane protein
MVMLKRQRQSFLSHENSMIKLVRQTVSFQALGYFFQFAAFFVFARILGTEGQGILTIFRATGQIIVSIMWVGLPAGIVYFIGRDNHFFFFLLKNCLKWFVFVFPLLVLLLYLVPINSIPKLNLKEQYIAYLLIFIFLLSFFNLFQGLILSLKKYVYYNLFAFGLGIVILSFSILAGLLPRNHDKLTFAIVSYIVGYGLMFFYGLVLVSFEGRRLKSQIRKKVSFLDQFMVGFRGFISSIAGLLLFRLDLFLVGYFLSFREVGIYSIALFGAEMISKIPYWSSSILTPMVASNEEGHVRRTVYLFYSSIIIALLLGLFLVSILVIFPDFISNLIGKDFTGAEVCLLLLLPRVIMQSGGAVLAANLAGKGYPWHHPACAISGLISVILLDLLLIPRYGIVGAAVASSVGFTSTFVIVCIGFYVHNITNGENVRNYSVKYIEDVKRLFSTKILRI